MKIKNSIVAAFVVFITLVGCKEDQIEMYTGAPAMNIGIVNVNDGVDTVRVYPFGFIEDKEVELNVKLYLSGVRSNEDRVVELAFSGTAVQGTDFEMNDKVTLKAGQIEALTTCKIKRAGDLVNGAKNLIINVKANSDFNPSIMHRSRINFSDEIPSDWLNVQYNYGDYYLGACSKIKYLFLYEITDIYDFAPYPYTFVQTAGKYVQSKVDEYNLDPEAFEVKYGITPGKYGPAPMEDENGELVKYV